MVTTYRKRIKINKNQKKKKVRHTQSNLKVLSAHGHGQRAGGWDRPRLRNLTFPEKRTKEEEEEAGDGGGGRGRKQGSRGRRSWRLWETSEAPAG